MMVLRPPARSVHGLRMLPIVERIEIQYEGIHSSSYEFAAALLTFFQYSSQIGQMLMIPLDTSSLNQYAIDMIQKHYVGGILLSRRNIKRKFP